MQYLLLITIDEDAFAARYAPADRQGQVRWTRDLIEAGIHRAADRLARPETARTVRRLGGQALVTDGPFVETKEHLGGYYLVEQPDLDAAARLTLGMPVAGHADVAVRPVETARLFPRDGARPDKQCMLLCYGVAPKVAPANTALRAWMRLDPHVPGPSVAFGALRPPAIAPLPHAVALLDGDLGVAEAIARVVVPEGGAIELRPVRMD